MDLSKYRQLYVSETQENLEKLGQLVVELENAPERTAHVDTVFRLFHSIKGMSGTMGYTPMFDLAHQLEELMDRVRRGERPVSTQICDLLLAGVDRMSQWVVEVEADRVLDPRPALSLRSRISTLLSSKSPEQPVLKPDRPRAQRTPPPSSLPIHTGDLVVFAEIDPQCPDPGVRGFLLIRKISDFGRIRGSIPSVDILRSGRLDGPLQLSIQTSLSPAQLEAFIRLLPDWRQIEVYRHGEAQSQKPPADPDDLLFTGDLNLGGINPDLVRLHTPDPAPPVGPPLSTHIPTNRRTAAIVRAPGPSRTIRVRTEWLDTLLDRIGDLLVTSQQLSTLDQETPDSPMTEGLKELSRVLNALHTDALSVRMTPLAVLTNRLPRVARDLARQAGKRAVLVVNGEDQRLDRAIIEALDAPLTHLLTNAIEHGIEAPEVREAAGKPASGTLTLDCVRIRDEIIVELSDDGAGIDAAKLVERAVLTGMMERSRAEALAERCIDRLVCMPGLSAQEEAGALSGRGVGMDVVAEAVASLGGHLEILTKLGQGTTVRMHLPRAPGISKLLMVGVADQTFGLPSSRIIRTVALTREQLQNTQQTTIELDGKRLSIVGLRSILGMPPSIENPQMGILYRHQDSTTVIIVDRVEGRRDAVFKPLGELLERIDGLLGITIDSMGKPVLVIDAMRIPHAERDD